MASSVVLGCLRTTSNSGIRARSSCGLSRENAGGSLTLSRMNRPTSTRTMLTRNGIRQPPFASAFSPNAFTVLT